MSDVLGGLFGLAVIAGLAIGGFLFLSSQAVLIETKRLDTSGGFAGTYYVPPSAVFTCKYFTGVGTIERTKSMSKMEADGYACARIVRVDVQ